MWGVFFYTSRAGIFDVLASFCVDSLTHLMLVFLFLSGESLLHIPCWFLFLSAEFLLYISCWVVVVVVFLSGEFLLHILCWFLFLTAEFLLHISCWLHFCLGSFSYTSRAGFIFIWGVSLTHPVLASFFIWGVSLTHSVLASFLCGELLWYAVFSEDNP